MCGIYGIANFVADHPVDLELLYRMDQSMFHRGPDDRGHHEGRGIAIGMRRLSIIDVSGGRQPISNEDGSIWVVCNGEIYNYRELRKELETRGHRFGSHSDTEVLVHLYEDCGDRLVEQLRGMFAFALWDSRRRRLLICRDRLGIKPLYYNCSKERLIFASEIKGLLADPSLERQVDVQALRDYLAWGYVPAPRTLFAGISKLLPAHSLIVESGQVRKERYWELRFDKPEQRSEEEWAEAVREGLEESVRSHLVSDVPLGAFLSGGLDSSAVVSMMSRLSDRPVKTFSIGFGEEDKFYNELPYAKQVADACETEHHEIVVRPNVFELFPKLIWHLDEPIADSAFVTTYLVSQFAREQVTVILSGVGGDELFGGYTRYLGAEIGRYYEFLPGWMRRRTLPGLFRRLPADRHSSLLNYFRLAKAFVESHSLPPQERYLSYLSVFSQPAGARLLSPDFRPGLPADSELSPLLRHLRESSSEDLRNQMMELDLKTQLPDDLLALTDKMSMAASLECRVPFLDHRLVELAARIPACLKINNLRMKYILKKAIRPLLPPAILKRKKRGFGAPIGSWLRRDLRSLSAEILSEASVRNRGFFEWEAVRQTVDLHLNGMEDHTDHLLSLINFELWCRTYLDNVRVGASSPL